ncbi:hypothetical protein GQ53DRAFT_787177 [Thozetella sp. PMI_491]|nr:hypothetical protein GQ53DRAFT_787177 [Thozetella sp. PMI_491]
MPQSHCQHKRLYTEVSPNADEVGYARPPLAKRIAATTPSGRAPSQSESELQGQEDSYTFPAPLVLPEDDLAWEPRHPPQSLRSWIREIHRNPVTQRRKILYVAQAPRIEAEVSTMKNWIRPVLAPDSGSPQEIHDLAASLATPESEAIRDYLEAFYHGLEVKFLPSRPSFVAWDKKRAGSPSHVGLRIGTTCTRVRTRPCPDGVFSHQLNLNDILDAAIESLPDDAYSVLLMTDHDLYEDDDDDFCCGRAYGGSRVAVVSSSRYHPALDDQTGLDLEHMWPASHCRTYVARECGVGASKKQKMAADAGPDLRPLQAAVKAAGEATDPSAPGPLWFSRVARTASHELGHCLALGHCIYYACVMQGTAGMAEDVRQPPYLCPVCLSKISRAVLEVQQDKDEKKYIEDRYRALSNFCRKWRSNAMFAGYGAWLDTILKV